MASLQQEEMRKELLASREANAATASLQQEEMRKELLASREAFAESLGAMEERLVKRQDALDTMLPMVFKALTPNPWDDLSQQTKRPDNFLSTIAPSWVEVLKYPHFCCVLQGAFGATCEDFKIDCEKWTVGAHIVPHSCKFQTIRHLFPEWTALSIDSPANGLPLCKELEAAFDAQRWCLNYDESGRCWRFLLLDDTLRGRITLTSRTNKEPTRFQIKGLTWESLQGVAVPIADIVSRKALLFHAVCSATTHQKSSLVNVNGDRKREKSPRQDVQAWLTTVVHPTAVGEANVTA
jgi:hypothetical protein